LNQALIPAAMFKADLQVLLSSTSPDQSPNVPFAHVSDDLWLWMNTAGYRENEALRQILPALPEELVQNRFTGRAWDTTLNEGFAIYRLFRGIFEQHRGRVSEFDALMDFGVGWGRVIRFFLKDLDPAKLWGVDCLPEAIEASKVTNRWCNFELIEPLPPSRFADNSLDGVYCYSVYSHLSEDAHLRWLLEFKRILKPGGIFISTTRPRSFIEYCGQVRKMDTIPPWAVGTAAAFPDEAHWLRTYDAGDFCHTATGGGTTLSDSFYGESAIPEQYIRHEWTKHMSVLEYISDPARCEQNVIVVQKPL